MIRVSSIFNNKVYLKGDVEVEVGDVYLSEDDGRGTLFVKTTNIPGIVTYGYKTKFEDKVWDKPAGYVWSSRASVMNKTFGLKLIDVIYNNRCVAIDLDTLEPLLKGTGYRINNTPEEDDEDISYSVEIIPV